MLEFPMGGSVRRLAVSSLLCFGAAMWTARASAQDDAEPLTVERGPGAEECPDAASLGARVAAIRGRPGAPSGSSYDVSFSRTLDAFSAVIRSGANAESQRVLEDRGPSCAALAQATAVTLALLLDSEADSASEPPKAEAAEPAAPKPPAELANPILIDVRERGPRVDGTVSLGVAGLAFVLRPISPAFNAELGLRVARFRAGIGVLWNPPQTLALAPGDVRESLLVGTARSCFALARAEAFRFELCSGLFAGVTTAEGQGFTRNERRVRSWLAIPLELSLAEISSPIGWELGVSALGSLAHRDFSIDNLGPAYQSPRVGAMISLRAVGLFSL
ncbi:MAG TPA: hypothetical protein VHV51_10520 [Polyangiaceae bacterium]|jgi:hypothetical protein|nr:hypothetical protein [Polyangiaceae bacterium]